VAESNGYLAGQRRSKSSKLLAMEPFVTSDRRDGKYCYSDLIMTFRGIIL
jgi:hypothetical protein